MKIFKNDQNKEFWSIGHFDKFSGPMFINIGTKQSTLGSWIISEIITTANSNLLNDVRFTLGSSRSHSWPLEAIEAIHNIPFRSTLLAVVFKKSLHLKRTIKGVSALHQVSERRDHHTEALEAGNVVQVVVGAAADTVLVVEVQVESAATVIPNRKIFKRQTEIETWSSLALKWMKFYPFYNCKHISKF